MSRREFVKYLVAAATLDFLGFGGISSDSPDNIPTPGVYQERNPQFSPVTVNLGVVTVAADGLARYDGDDKIRRDIAEQTARITHTTSGAYHFNSAATPNLTVRGKLKRERQKHIIPTTSWKR